MDRETPDDIDNNIRKITEQQFTPLLQTNIFNIVVIKQLRRRSSQKYNPRVNFPTYLPSPHTPVNFQVNLA